MIEFVLIVAGFLAVGALIAAVVYPRVSAMTAETEISLSYQGAIGKELPIALMDSSGAVSAAPPAQAKPYLQELLNQLSETNGGRSLCALAVKVRSGSSCAESSLTVENPYVSNISGGDADCSASQIASIFTAATKSTVKTKASQIAVSTGKCPAAQFFVVAAPTDPKLVPDAEALDRLTIIYEGTFFKVPPAAYGGSGSTPTPTPTLVSAGPGPGELPASL